MSRPAGVPLRRKLTKDSVDRLPTPGGDYYYQYDRDVRQLAIRVMASGRRFYVVRAVVKRTGRQAWTAIGEHGQPGKLTPEEATDSKAAKLLTPEEARNEAKRLIGLVAGGADFGEARRVLAGADTLRAAARNYAIAMRDGARKRPATLDADLRLFGLEDLRIEHRAVKSEKAKKARRILDDTIADLKVPAITRDDVERFMKRWRSTPIRANRALALLSHLLGKWAKCEPNPCKGVEKNAETKKKRYLSAEELGRLGQALSESKADPRALAALRVLLFTGARRGEVLSLEWEKREGCAGYVDFAAKKLVLLLSKTGAKDVMLPPPALEVLQALKAKPGNPYVFAGEAPGKPLQNIGHVWEDVRAVAGLADVRLHDLRHSFASVAVAGNASLSIIGGLLGHASTKTTERYAHLAESPLRAVADSTAASIAASLGAKAPAGKVLEMKRGRRKA